MGELVVHLISVKRTTRAIIFDVKIHAVPNFVFFGGVTTASQFQAVIAAALDVVLFGAVATACLCSVI